MPPGSERGGRKAFVARHALEGKEARELFARPDQHRAHILPGAEDLQRRQQHPVLVKRVRLERGAGELFPGRHNAFELCGAARHRDARSLLQRGSGSHFLGR